MNGGGMLAESVRDATTRPAAARTRTENGIKERNATRQKQNAING